MNINTILQILYANKLEHVVSLAIQIDNNIPSRRTVEDKIIVQVSRDSLPEGKTFEGNNHWGKVQCTIVGISIYSLDKPYLILLPNGTTKSIGEDDIEGNNVTPIINVALVP